MKEVDSGQGWHVKTRAEQPPQVGTEADHIVSKYITGMQESQS